MPDSASPRPRESSGGSPFHPLHLASAAMNERHEAATSPERGRRDHTGSRQGWRGIVAGSAISGFARSMCDHVIAWINAMVG